MARTTQGGTGMISKQELVDGIRFAGERAAAAAKHCRDWDHQLGHQWTSGDAFRHIAATSSFWNSSRRMAIAPPQTPCESQNGTAHAAFAMVAPTSICRCICRPCWVSVPRSLKKPIVRPLRPGGTAR